MKKIPCLYSIVRFAPFVETGEYANVGIVMISPKQRFFDFKLLIQRHARVTHFFEQLEPKMYRATMRNLLEELTRVSDMLHKNGFYGQLDGINETFARGLFGEIVRPRETVIKFSEPRPVLAEDAHATLEELYGYYVDRNFVTREYQEAVLERGLRKWLTNARLGDRFTRSEL